MRRNDKALKDRPAIDRVIRACRICTLAMADGGEPYAVPLNFGYDGASLYFHSAAVGKKIDILHKNPRVWFSFHTGGGLVRTGDGVCGWTSEYESVMGSGQVVFLRGESEKRRGLDILTAHAAAGGGGDYDPRALDRILVFRVDILSLSGKKSPIRRGEDADG